MKPESEASDADIFGDCGNGVLDIAISDAFDKSGKSWNPGKGTRWLHLCINDKDFFAVSSQIFRLVTGKTVEIENNVIKDWKDGYRKIRFEFPMLSKIKQMYADALFEAEEVNKLREECIRIKSLTTNSDADLGLRKLIYSCDEALKAGFCLGLWCD